MQGLCGRSVQMARTRRKTVEQNPPPRIARSRLERGSAHTAAVVPKRSRGSLYELSKILSKRTSVATSKRAWFFCGLRVVRACRDKQCHPRDEDRFQYGSEFSLPLAPLAKLGELPLRSIRIFQKNPHNPIDAIPHAHLPCHSGFCRCC